jgi:hypothetical protein
VLLNLWVHDLKWGISQWWFLFLYLYPRKRSVGWLAGWRLQFSRYRLETLNICSWVDLRELFFSCGSVHYFFEGAWFNKILWRELLLWFLRYWLETLNIFFVWISPLLYPPQTKFGGYIGVIIRLVRWLVSGINYAYNFQDIDLKL